MLFDPANLSYWIFLGIGIALFLLVIISGGGDDDLDLDADVDADLDLDADADIDGDGDFSTLAFLGWLGFGKAPLILLLAIDFSFWGLTGWILNIVVGGLTGSIPTNLIGLGGLILLISLSISLSIGSFFARPLGKIFASFGEDISSDRLIGCVGNVASKQVPYEGNKSIAQADILDPANNLVTVAVCLPSWAQEIPVNGQEVLVIEQTEKYYLVIKSEGLDREQWLNNYQQDTN
ncbi:conserved membrane hypothetical protein [Hyella patelloides LEGE 07179]|uniref:Inner membrane protein YqiJ N-terminal domain-containing protein n=1 Tax=Hyella patelloides LEGE 07179 TaxID=945734 RepID=A0A563W2L0_9CYAN|nr:OB-fold-containig protein [Hyella patelloides]VEP17944.1 conserved membrane hypothetical protein [Hyella patelloides LEGE 07179]